MNGSAWIGRKSRREERITPRQLAEFRVTFGALLDERPVPPGFHWCLVPDLAPAADLGRDGHPRPGIFVPELLLPRRMWAGGEIAFAREIPPDTLMERASTVRDVVSKSGSTGPLAFVTIDHEWFADGVPVLRERQDLVYRKDPKPGEKPKPPQAEPWEAESAVAFMPDATMLFRYSALTFNGHRIHYDHPYATGVEGYDGLVVHGPMQAMVMMNMASRLLGRLPSNFRYRGVSPLICGVEAVIEARRTPDGYELRTRTGDGGLTMTASAR
ncbi:MaoC family dehydratase N-terminal domain-containing protein [Shinella sp.]|uniref:FAS1-like dehydratase domain-containing protein n=1 Tax=Shinella sp. TaxID=1870904 RepID=UPI00301DD51A